uniref:Uncharacterized protein n=1 Tax=Noctiluca scintillans TaxID=2966 RepID=A0A7S0ZTN5_NOCSC
MPIDYSKFDNIEDSDDEPPPPGGKDHGLDFLQQYLKGAEGSGRSDDASLLDHNPYPDLDDDFGGGAERLENCLDASPFRDEAWTLLLARLVVNPRAAELPRLLLLEAELQISASRYRDALIAAIAVSLVVGEEDVGNWACGKMPEEWAAPVLVIEMVAAYQLGAREHAVELRDQLKTMNRESLSKHLQKRFDGTSEILELVPQFLSMLQSQKPAT